MRTMINEEKLLMTAFYSAMKQNRMLAELIKENPTLSVMARYQTAESDYANARHNFVTGTVR